MAIDTLFISIPSIIAICIMIGALVFGILKKWSITASLIVANFLVFFITFLFEGSIYELGFIPIYLNVSKIPYLYTLFTSMFTHGGILHIIGNMIVLFFVGSALEQRVGWKKFLTIYLVSGLIATLTHAFVNINSTISLVGASGAVFGIMGALLYGYPHDKILMPIPLGFFAIIRRIKVIYAVVLFAVIETFFIASGFQDQTAHFAHLGGIIGGVIIGFILIKKGQTHTKNNKTIYYNPFMAGSVKKFEKTDLKQFADTPELRDMLKKIENETVPQVQDLWLEHFFEKAVCPKCRSKLNHFNRSVWCDKCGFKTKY